MANNPAAFNNFVAGVEPRLNRLYTDTADRVARQLVVAENEVSMLGTENRAEIYDGTNNISLHTRGLYASLRKGSVQILTPSSTVLQNVTDLSVAVAINAIYIVRGVLYFDASTVADVKFAFTWPAGAGMRWGLVGPALVTAGDAVFNTSAGSGTALSVGGAGVGTVLMAVLEGDLVTAGTAGTLQLQAAQNTSEATNVSVHSRSRLDVWRVA